MLSILISKWVLGTPFPGVNHLFQHFNIIFHHKQKKRRDRTKNKFQTFSDEFMENELCISHNRNIIGLNWMGRLKQ